MTEIEIQSFLKDYNVLLSNAGNEYKGKFAALASPTLNKQETITFLYQNVNSYIDNSNRKRKHTNEFVSFILLVLRLGYRFIVLWYNSIKFKISNLPENCIYIRTWLVPRSIKNNEVRDDYFHGLADDLKKENSVIVGFQPVVYGNLLTKFYKSKRPENFIVPVGFLRFKDIVSLLFVYFTCAKIQLKGKYIYRGKDVSQLINESLKRDYYNCLSFQAYLELYIAKKIRKYNPSIFLYVFENQAWENSYLLEFKGTRTKTLGYQSSGFSYRFLNFFPTAIDSRNALFPDKILTVGDLYTEFLKSHGSYPIPIETFAALRFDYPVENGMYKVKSTIDTVYKRILYAFPVHFYQYPRIIKDLIQVFGDTQVEVYLKFHPLYSERANEIELPANFRIWKSNQSKDLNELYDFVLFNDNSFGIESLMEGVKSFEYIFGELYPETRLVMFDSYSSTIDKNGLIRLRDDLVSGSFSKKIDNEEIIKYVNNCYKPYSSSLMNVVLNN